MPWPNNFSDGELLTLSRINEWPNALQTTFPFQDHPRVRLTPGSTGFGGAGSPVVVDWSSASENVGGMWSSSQPSRVTAVVSGPHMVVARINNTTNRAVGVRVRLRKNGADISTCAENFSPAVLTTVVSMNSGDYLELTVESFGGVDSVHPSTSELYVEAI